jgi:hypothetical protein
MLAALGDLISPLEAFADARLRVEALLRTRS